MGNSNSKIKKSNSRIGIQILGSKTKHQGSKRVPFNRSRKMLQDDVGIKPKGPNLTRVQPLQSYDQKLKIKS